MTVGAPSVFDALAREAVEQSELWQEALMPAEEWEADAIFSRLAPERYALATESIYEGYLLHYGRPRIFAPHDPDVAVLLGDYLYAHGLVRLAAAGNAEDVLDFAELISLCAQLRAGTVPGDGVAWLATSALLGVDDPRLERARAALRLERETAPFVSLVESSAPAEDVDRALAAHARRFASFG
jgi:hypothetical protein